jgi:hypothetical protein
VRGDFVYSELTSGENAAMARDNSLFSIDQNGVCEPEFPDTGGDLRYLRVRMDPGIARVRDQRLDRAHEDLVRQLHSEPSRARFL